MDGETPRKSEISWSTASGVLKLCTNQEYDALCVTYVANIFQALLCCWLQFTQHVGAIFPADCERTNVNCRGIGVGGLSGRRLAPWLGRVFRCVGTPHHLLVGDLSLLDQLSEGWVMRGWRTSDRRLAPFPRMFLFFPHLMRNASVLRVKFSQRKRAKSAVIESLNSLFSPAKLTGNTQADHNSFFRVQFMG